MRHVRAASFQRPIHRIFLPSFSRGWASAARRSFILLACLAQLLLPLQQGHGFAPQSAGVTLAATDTRVALTGFNDVKPSLRCAFAAHGGSQNHGAPAPCCQHDNCACCPSAHSAAGILPSETTRAAYTPRLFEAVAPPVHLGAIARFAAFAGQPRAPPILI